MRRFDDNPNWKEDGWYSRSSIDGPRTKSIIMQLREENNQLRVRIAELEDLVQTLINANHKK